MITDINRNPPPSMLVIDGVTRSLTAWLDILTAAQWEEMGYRECVIESGPAPLGYLPAVAQEQSGVPIWFVALAGTPEEREAAVLQQAREAMQCSDLQALLAIDAMGLSAQYEAWASAPERTFAEKAFIQRARTWKRTDPVFNAAADALSKSEQEKDQFFALAATL